MTIREPQVVPVAVAIAFVVWENDNVMFLSLQLSKYSI